MTDVSSDRITMSNAVEVRDGEPQTFILQAQTHIAEDRWGDALKAIVKAYNAARPHIGDLMQPSRRGEDFPDGDPELRRPVEFPHSYSMTTGVLEASRRLEYHAGVIDHLRDQMGHLEELLALLSVGISLPDYWRFKALVPDRSASDKDWEIVRPGAPLTREHVEAALNFVVTAVQRWQALDALRDEVMRAQSSASHA